MAEKEKKEISSSKTILEIFIFFLIIAAASAYWKNISITRRIDSASNQQTQTIKSPVPVTVTETHVAPTSQVAVTYTAKGFTPQSVTVSIGDTVVFNNKSNTSFWPVSDADKNGILIYPSFDARQQILPGQAYSITFTKSGTWKYHNQLKQTFTGTVIVK